MKTIKIMIIVFILSTILLGCSQEENISNDIYQHKTDYVGNNSEVIHIVRALDYPKNMEIESIEIKSQKEPYGLNLFTNKNKLSKKDNFKNSVIIFSLIGNLSQINYLDPTDEISILSFNRDEVDEILLEDYGKSTEEIGNTQESFSKFYNKY